MSILEHILKLAGDLYQLFYGIDGQRDRNGETRDRKHRYALYQRRNHCRAKIAGAAEQYVDKNSDYRIDDRFL